MRAHTHTHHKGGQRRTIILARRYNTHRVGRMQVCPSTHLKAWVLLAHTMTGCCLFVPHCSPSPALSLVSSRTAASVQTQTNAFPIFACFLSCFSFDSVGCYGKLVICPIKHKTTHNSFRVLFGRPYLYFWYLFFLLVSSDTVECYS